MVPRPPFTLKEVAQILGRNPSTIRRWIKTGKVKIKVKKNQQGSCQFTQNHVDKLKKYRNSVH